MEAQLQLRHVTCVRGGRLLFQGVDALLEPGQVMVLTGPNGTGKTSLLRMVCGLMTPDEGEVLWCGHPISRQREPFARQLLYAGHSAALKDDLTVSENLRIGMLAAGWRADGSELNDALARAGLSTRTHVPARFLSQGQRRRLTLARLELGNLVPLWVLDEPFTALDTDAVAWIEHLIAHHARAGGMTVLTTHQGVTLDAAIPMVGLSL